jgi:hypothetical protein
MLRIAFLCVFVLCLAAAAAQTATTLESLMTKAVQMQWDVKAAKGEAKWKLMVEQERFNEQILIPAFEENRAAFKNPDDRTMKLFLLLLTSYKDSADFFWADFFAYVFAYNEPLVAKHVKQLPPDDKRYLVQCLHYGLEKEKYAYMRELEQKKRSYLKLLNDKRDKVALLAR